jgi:hypothetical protein
MATITKRELVSKALAKHDIVGAGQTATGEDYVHGLDALRGLLAQLEHEHGLLVPVTAGADESLDAIDVRYMHPLRELVAYEVANDFGKPQEPARRLMYVGQIQSMLEVGTDFEPVAFTDY